MSCSDNAAGTAGTASSALVKTVEAADQKLPADADQAPSLASYYERLFAPLRDFAMPYLGRAGAEDAVQDVMCDLLSRWPIDRPRDSFFYRAVRNRIAVIRRNEYRHRNLLTRFLYRLARRSRDLTAPDAGLEESEFRDVVAAAVAGMPERCKEVWRLSWVSDLTFEQIADALELSPVTVRRHASRANALLETALENAGYCDDTPAVVKGRAKLLPAPPPAAAADEATHD